MLLSKDQINLWIIYSDLYFLTDLKDKNRGKQLFSKYYYSEKVNFNLYLNT
jgi:hypothetical protein